MTKRSNSNHEWRNFHCIVKCTLKRKWGWQILFSLYWTFRYKHFHYIMSFYWSVAQNFSRSLPWGHIYSTQFWMITSTLISGKYPPVKLKTPKQAKLYDIQLCACVCLYICGSASVYLCYGQWHLLLIHFSLIYFDGWMCHLIKCKYSYI